MSPRKIFTSCFWFLIAGFAMQGCANSESREGVVIDIDTGEPISDAYVVGQWSKGGTERTVCFQIDMTKTDSSGKYSLPAPRFIGGSWFEDKSLTVLAHKKGFRQIQYGSDGAYLDPGRSGVVQMEMLGADPNESSKRLEILREMARNMTCNTAGDSPGNVAEVYHALYEEALEYAGETESESILFLRKQVEKYELGPEKASERYQAGLRRLKGEEEAQATPEIRVIEHVDQEARGAARINE